MRTITIFFLLCFNPLSTNSQEDYVYYLSKSLKMELWRDGQSEPFQSLPVSNNIRIRYNNFYKTYNIKYVDENGKIISLKLRYKGEVGNIIDSYYVDDFNNQLVVSNIFINGEIFSLLIHLPKEENEDFKKTFTFDDFTLVDKERYYNQSGFDSYMYISPNRK
jgi:hypothetical protein